jgi:hypothetical protein
MLYLSQQALFQSLISCWVHFFYPLPHFLMLILLDFFYRHRKNKAFLLNQCLIMTFFC